RESRCDWFGGAKPRRRAHAGHGPAHRGALEGPANRARERGPERQAVADQVRLPSLGPWIAGERHRRQSRRVRGRAHVGWLSTGGARTGRGRAVGRALRRLVRRHGRAERLPRATRNSTRVAELRRAGVCTRDALARDADEVSPAAAHLITWTTSTLPSRSAGSGSRSANRFATHSACSRKWRRTKPSRFPASFRT